MEQEQALKDHYIGNIKIKHKLTRRAVQKQLSFFQNILLLSVTLVGILVSLHNNTSSSLCNRVVFLLSVLFLVFGILTLCIATFDTANLSNRLRQAFQKEFELAAKDHRTLRIVSIERKKRTSIFEKVSYALLVTGLLLLAVYTVLQFFTSLN